MAQEVAIELSDKVVELSPNASFRDEQGVWLRRAREHSWLRGVDFNGTHLDTISKA